MWRNIIIIDSKLHVPGQWHVQYLETGFKRYKKGRWIRVSCDIIRGSVPRHIPERHNNNVQLDEWQVEQSRCPWKCALLRRVMPQITISRWFVVRDPTRTLMYVLPRNSLALRKLMKSFVHVSNDHFFPVSRFSPLRSWQSVRRGNFFSRLSRSRLSFNVNYRAWSYLRENRCSNNSVWL